MEMRVRLPELMNKRGMTAYGLSVASNNRISMSTAYRLVKLRGELKTFDAEMLEALCDVFGIGPGEVLEREKRRKVG
jgi:DNA-binding Xre family transcriptional regulator